MFWSISSRNNFGNGQNSLTAGGFILGPYFYFHEGCHFALQNYPEVVLLQLLQLQSADNKLNHKKNMKDWASIRYYFLCCILFEVTEAFGNMWDSFVVRLWEYIFLGTLGQSLQVSAAPLSLLWLHFHVVGMLKPNPVLWRHTFDQAEEILRMKISTLTSTTETEHQHFLCPPPQARAGHPLLPQQEGD